MLLGYIRPDGRHSADVQRTILAAFRHDGKKIEKLWEDKRDDATYPQRKNLARALRSKSDVIVVTHFHRLADPGDDIKFALAELCARYCITIIEATTGRHVDCTAADGI
jgi:DNA invertase Pin-like site-specific DNA recombinase